MAVCSRGHDHRRSVKHFLKLKHREECNKWYFLRKLPKITLMVISISLKRMISLNYISFEKSVIILQKMDSFLFPKNSF